MERTSRGEAGFTEDDLVAAIRKVLSGEQPGVAVGIGDDAAVVEPGRGDGVITTDMLVEGVHFDRGLVSPSDLGYKAIVVNVSDVAAMGGSPRYAVVSLGLSPEVGPPFVIELYAGIREACERYGLSLVGGDLDRSSEVVISVTVVGEVAHGRAILRSGAQPGERIVVTGSLGRAAAGLLVARAKPSRVSDALASDWGRDLLQAQARPEARVGEGQTLAQAGATAMMDLSDGLSRDLARLCAESGVGARIELASVPVAEPVRELSKVLQVDPLKLALSGGEDYELLATLHPGTVERTARKLVERFGTPLTDIGEVTEAGLVAVEESGEAGPLEPAGWDHFA